MTGPSLGSTHSKNQRIPRGIYTSDCIKIYLQAAVVAIRKDILGFVAEKLGSHSIRSRAARAICLDKELVYTIMIMRKWSNDVF